MIRDFYTSKSNALLADFDRHAQPWRSVLSERYGKEFATAVLEDARARYGKLIPDIPYIGGDENHLTHALVESAEILALFRAMEAAGKTPAETGKVLFDAILRLPPPPPIPPEQLLSTTELAQRRGERAAGSLERRHPADFVYEYVTGDGKDFDFGYNFLECASEKFYRAQDALKFMPYYCFLDFPGCARGGLGLTRRGTLAEGCRMCDFRFVEGGEATQTWPPSFSDGAGQTA